MSLALRLTPGVALAAAGILVLAPAVSAPAVLNGMHAGIPPLSLHIEDVQLTGIGQDLYYAVTPYVQYVVGGVSYVINFIPLIGGPTAAQININYFQGIQPVIESTVNYLAAVVQDPFNLVAATGAYGDQLYGIGYNWVDAELRFFGLPPLPPLPPAMAPVDAPAGIAPRAPVVSGGAALPGPAGHSVTAEPAPGPEAGPEAGPEGGVATFNSDRAAARVVGARAARGVVAQQVPQSPVRNSAKAARGQGGKAVKGTRAGSDRSG